MAGAGACWWARTTLPSTLWISQSSSPQASGATEHLGQPFEEPVAGLAVEAAGHRLPEAIVGPAEIPAEILEPICPSHRGGIYRDLSSRILATREGVARTGEA